MNVIAPSRVGLFLVSAIVMALQGCSVGKTYREIDPERADANEKKNYGYLALKSVPPGVAKLVLRAEGERMSATFAISKELTGCEGFVPIGVVQNSDHGEVLPWIAKMGRRAPGYLAITVPDEPVQIRGSSAWTSQTANVITTYSCGPVVVQFTPSVDRAYLVRFVSQANSCGIAISDATNPDAPLPVATAVKLCAKQPRS